MWPPDVVMCSPAFDEDLCFSQRIEEHSVKQRDLEPSIEGSDIAVLQRAALLDIGDLGTNGCNAITNRVGNKLETIVAVHERRWSAQDELVEQDVDQLGRVQLPN